MNIAKYKTNLMFARTTVLYKYIKSFSNDIPILSGNAHVGSKLYLEFYHCIAYIAKNNVILLFIINLVDI